MGKKSAAELRDMLVKCASTSLNSKLVRAPLPAQQACLLCQLLSPAVPLAADADAGAALDCS